MIELKTILGVITIFIAFIAYIPYFRNILLGKTKPHAFSWLVWSILVAIGFFGQISEGAGAGAWVTGFTALICVAVFFLALKKGERNITLSDKLSFGGVCFALLLWYLTNNPLTAIILIIIIDALGFYPTFRKSYNKPHEETMLTFFLSGLKFAIALFALENYTVVTYLYPAALVIMNWALTGFLIIRRKQHVK